MIDYPITLNLQNTHEQNTHIEAPMANVGSIRFFLYVYNNADEIDYMSYDLARVVFQKNNGNRTQNDCFITSTHILCEVKSTDYDYAGRVNAELWLYKDDVKAAPIPFRFMAVASVGANLIPSENQMDAFDTLLTGLQSKYDNFPFLNSLGTYPMVDALTAAYPDGLDEFGRRLQGGFFVTSFDPPHFFTWSTITERWEDMGSISGAKGTIIFNVNANTPTAPVEARVNDWLMSLSDSEIIVGNLTMARGDVAKITSLDPFELELIGNVRGEKGDTGSAATIEVLRTETLAAGSQAVVINEGTENAAQFVFKLPQGENGADGEGSGDMTAATYDPQGKKKDVFAAIEDSVEAHIIDPMPHQFTDGSVVYRYGLQVNNGIVVMVYEEVE